MTPFALKGTVKAGSSFKDQKNSLIEIVYDPIRQIHVIKTANGYDDAFEYPSYITATMQTPTVCKGSLDDEDAPKDG